MDSRHTLDRRYELVAWGLLFLWWGLRWWLLVALPNGSGLLGSGLILVGLNAARSWKGLPTRRSTTDIGLLALALGGILYLASAVFHLPVEVPLFEGVLVGFGAFFLIRALRGGQNESPG